MRANLAAFSLLLWASLTSALHAQSGAPSTPPGNASVRDPASDSEWARVSALFKPKPSAAVAKTPAQAVAARQQRRDDSLNAAREAKTFYQRFPNHPSAGTARKFEALSLITSLRHGNSAVEREALATADAFRQDKNLYRADRFDVALSVERYRMHQRGGVRSARQAPADHEAFADLLSREFGPVPEIFGLYLSIAKEVDMDSANRLATKVLEMRPSPAARAEAEAITTRYGRVGHPLNTQLTSTSGDRVSIAPSLANGSRTVLYVWNHNGMGRNPFASLDALKADLGRQSGVRWFFVTLRGRPEDATAARAKAPVDGIHCYESGDARSNASAAQLFRGIAGPSVFVLNGRGLLVGFGPPEDLPKLLAAAAR